MTMEEIGEHVSAAVMQAFPALPTLAGNTGRHFCVQLVDPPTRAQVRQAVASLAVHAKGWASFTALPTPFGDMETVFCGPVRVLRQYVEARPEDGGIFNGRVLIRLDVRGQERGFDQIPHVAASAQGDGAGE